MDYPRERNKISLTSTIFACFTGFYQHADPRYVMDLGSSALVLACIAGLLIAGCIMQPPPAGITTPAPGPLSPAVAGTPGAFLPAASGCARGTCTVVPVPASSLPGMNGTSLRIAVSPRRYTPAMSSVPGIGLTPEATGFTAADAEFSWNATFGEFLSWSAPDYTVTKMNYPVTNHGEELYWSFTDRPASAPSPVIITVVAKDPGSGALLGTSRVTLTWDGGYAVTVQNNQ
jgi:hypothetical protein